MEIPCKAISSWTGYIKIYIFSLIISEVYKRKTKWEVIKIGCNLLTFLVGYIQIYFKPKQNYQPNQIKIVNCHLVKKIKIP